MCVTYCHQKNLLFYNHDTCESWWCDLAERMHPDCLDCTHRRGEVCGLTRAPLPKADGCCHHSATLARGWRPVVESFQVAALAPAANETITDLLDGFDAPHLVDDLGFVWIDPDKLGVPEIYGRGTDED